MSDIKITYTKRAEKFLQKNPTRLTEEECTDLVRTAVLKLIGEETRNIDLKRLEGELKGNYRIRTGEIRIIFQVRFGIVHVASVEDINFRSSSY
ncbi:MAG TPA: hypothetical protein VIX80_03425 [Candidatus Kapabacteria bacterium]